jgi:hypothetical protein
VRRRVEEVLGFIGLEDYIDEMHPSRPAANDVVSRSHLP